MTNINKNLALQELQKLLVLNFSKTLSYMSDDFNNNQKYIIELLTKRVFLEEIVEETISFNKKINWDSSLKNLSIVTNAEDLIKVFELRSDVYQNINYQNVKFQIMFPLVSHLCFHFFKQVSRVKL